MECTTKSRRRERTSSCAASVAPSSTWSSTCESVLPLSAAGPGSSSAPRTGKLTITPSFNQARFLAHNLASVRAQGDLVLEHIVADGGDPPTAAASCSRARACDVSERRSRTGRRAQRGARSRRAADHRSNQLRRLLHRRRVARAVAALDADPSLDMVYGTPDQIDEKGAVIRRSMPIHQPRRAADSRTIPQPSVFVRRATIERASSVDVAIATRSTAICRCGWRWPARAGRRSTDPGAVPHSRRFKTVSRPSSALLAQVERAMEPALASPRLPPSLASRRRRAAAVSREIAQAACTPTSTFAPPQRIPRARSAPIRGRRSLARSSPGSKSLLPPAVREVAARTAAG